MNRPFQANIIAKSGKAVELAGDIDVVLLDKTGTITIRRPECNEIHANRKVFGGDVGVWLPWHRSR